MERYTVKFVTAGQGDRSILVPFNSSLTVGELKSDIARRLSRAGPVIDAVDLQLRLESPSGPILDEQDLVSDVVLHPSQETITALALTTDAGVGNAPETSTSVSLVSPI